ncbi:MAG: KTSC domain-containing protein [Rhodocyclaceae bacterium]|nr:KTSC domain-containing protein [Rhodocyclaceae bacterium]
MNPIKHHYHGVTGDQFTAMQKADSIGAYLGKHIKPNHKFTKI